MTSPHKLFSLISMMILVGWACALGSSGTPTPDLAVTSTLLAAQTQTAAVPTAAPTASPTPSPTPTATPPDTHPILAAAIESLRTSNYY